MAEEPEIVAAREYLEQVRRGDPIAEPPDAAAPPVARAPRAGDSAPDPFAGPDPFAAPDADAAHAGPSGIAAPRGRTALGAMTAPSGTTRSRAVTAPGAITASGAIPAPTTFAALAAPAPPLFLVPTAIGAELRDEDGLLLFGRLVELEGDANGPVAGAEMPGCVCRIAVERDRRGWLVAARQGTEGVVAACHLTWRAGGHVWMATDDWYRLRGTPVRSGPTWTLTAGEDEIAQIRRLPNHGLEIELAATPADAVLLLLLVAMVIRVETVSAQELVDSDGGGAG